MQRSGEPRPRRNQETDAGAQFKYSAPAPPTPPKPAPDSVQLYVSGSSSISCSPRAWAASPRGIPAQHELTAIFIHATEPICVPTKQRRERHRAAEIRELRSGRRTELWGTPLWLEVSIISLYPMLLFFNSSPHVIWSNWEKLGREKQCTLDLATAAS